MLSLARVCLQLLVVECGLVEQVVVCAIPVKVAHPHEMDGGCDIWDGNGDIRSDSLVCGHGVAAVCSEFYAV